jgi:acid-sensing ion channel, other
MKDHVDFTKGYVALYGNLGGVPHNLTDDELRGLEAIAQVCDPHLLSAFPINSGLQNAEILPLLRNITVSRNETTLFCKWRNDPGVCGDLFTEIITEEGFCYTFNVLHSAELFKEEVLAEDFVYLRHNRSSTNWTLERVNLDILVAYNGKYLLFNSLGL